MKRSAGLKLISTAMAMLMLISNSYPLAARAEAFDAYRQVTELLDAAQPQIENVTVESAPAAGQQPPQQSGEQPSPAPTESPVPAASPAPTSSPVPAESPAPAPSAAPTASPVPAASPAPEKETDAPDAQTPGASSLPGLYEDGVILISSYAQLLRLASGAPLTDADGNAVLDGDGAPVTYAADGQYAIVQDIELPEGGWLPPEGFTGRIAPREIAADRPLYDAASDTIYIYHTLQLAVLAQPDAGEEPVMNNDADPALFGVGQMIWPDGEEQPYLTYGAEHRYVLSTQFTTDLPKEMPWVNLMAETMTVPGANYEGRDFPGQVVKTIGNVDYILIGNEDQLRAIGTGADVYTAVYQTTTHSLAWNSTTIRKDSENQPVLRYGGDANLLAIQNGKGDFSFQRLEDVDESWLFCNDFEQNR